MILLYKFITNDFVIKMHRKIFYNKNAFLIILPKR